jgi:hypothetical protein
MVINGLTFDIGDLVRFKSINPQDSRYWQGTVVGFCGYNVASSYGDIIAYYQQVLAGMGGLQGISKLSDTTFMLINTDTESGSVVQAISPEWVDHSSFKLVEYSTSYTIQVTTRNGESVYDVLQLLRDNGFTCKALS